LLLLEDQQTMKTYYRILLDGQKENHRIRLMVVGMCEIGKTSLVNNLIEKSAEQNQVEHIYSTEGIDVHLCEITEGNKWNTLKAKREKKKITHVLDNVLQTEQQRVGPSETTPENKPPSLAEREHMLQDLLKKEAFEGPEQFQDSPIISVWDFAGHDVYYSTHHFFLNEGSIYLVLMDMTKDINLTETKQTDVIESFKFWINSIHMYSSTSDTGPETKPSIILVGTHKDQMKGTDKEKTAYMTRYFNTALESFQDNMDIMNRICPKKFLINNLDTNDPEFANIRQEVRKLAEMQDVWNERQPVKFVQLEKAFDDMREAGKEIITFDKVRELNTNIPAPLESDKEIIAFLKVQHMYGNVVFFDTDALRGYVILSPQWLIKAFKCFINHKDAHIYDIEPRLLGQWKVYRCTGANLSKELLVGIMKRSAYKLDCQIDVVISYMEHLNVMAKPICPEEYLEDEDCTGEDLSTIDRSARKVKREQQKHCKFYVVPCQLQPLPDDEIEKLTNPENWKQSHTLCFVFRNMFMPPATFHRLLVACMREWEIAQTKDTLMVYSRFGAFKTSQRSQLRLWYYDHIIYAKMVFQSRKKQDDDAVDPNTCQNCRRILYENLMAILGLLPRSSHLTKTTPFEEYIQCPKLRRHNEGLLKVSDFKDCDELTCEKDHKDAESHVIDKHEALKFWYKDTLDKIESKRDQDFDRLPTDKELLKIAQLLEKIDSWSLGIELGIENHTLEQIECEVRERMQNKQNFIFRILIKWKNCKCKNLPWLRKAIRAVQRNQDHFVDIYDILETKDSCNASNES